MGIIHRDLKPQNILINKNDDLGLCIKIADFGFSMISNVKCSDSNDYEYHICGTPGYIAPESIRFL